MYEIIAEQIKNQIMSGALKPGERLPTSKELSERYQVGRSTVREALSALEVMGFIETRQGEGSTVKIFKSEDVGMPDFQSFLVSRITFDSPVLSKKVLEEHRRIYQAIADQDPILAQQMMAEHLAHFEQEMRNHYQS
jgi:GntR family transcriptional repressor for pyruvate dehydrogenase complex